MHRLVAIVLAILAVSPVCAAEPGSLRVMFVGNSLTYVNNLPAVVAAYARAQPGGPTIDTVTYVAPGGTLQERWNDGIAAAAMRGQHIDVLVLQERGGVPACLQSDVDRVSTDCRDMVSAHRAFGALARERGTRVIVFETWSMAADGQMSQHDGAMRVAGRIGATVVHAGDALQAQARATSRAATFPDGVHPSLGATLVVGAQLYRAITGVAPTPSTLRVDFPLLAPRAGIDERTPLETQHAAEPPKVYLLERDALAPILERAARYR